MDFINLIKEKYETLTKSHKKIAKYIIDNYESVIFDTAAELSRKVSVSEVTVIRFAYALGFQSFSHMRRAMEKSVINNMDNTDIDVNKAFFMNESSDVQMDDWIQKQTLQLRKTYQNIDYEQFKEICNVLMNKKRVLIIGYMDSFGTASELLHLFDSIRSRVYFSKLMYENSYTFDDIDEDSATIVVSFTPHYKYTKELTETVKKNNSTVITITDSTINPLKDLSDYSLVFNLRRNNESGIIDTSPVIGFIYFMMNYLYENYREKIVEFRDSKRPLEEYIE